MNLMLRSAEGASRSTHNGDPATMMTKEDNAMGQGRG
jgi:hypothetical protein